jgi:hypothetical protein
VSRFSLQPLTVSIFRPISFVPDDAFPKLL